MLARLVCPAGCAKFVLIVRIGHVVLEIPLNGEVNYTGGDAKLEALLRELEESPPTGIAADGSIIGTKGPWWAGEWIEV